MKLNEFDNNDRLAHKSRDKKNRTIEERLLDIKNTMLSAEADLNKYLLNKIGRKDIIEHAIGETIEDISEFYDFCNHNSNDDSETRSYMEQLKKYYYMANDMLDKIQKS